MKIGDGPGPMPKGCQRHLDGPWLVQLPFVTQQGLSVGDMDCIQVIQTHSPHKFGKRPTWNLMAWTLQGRLVSCSRAPVVFRFHSNLPGRS